MGCMRTVGSLLLSSTSPGNKTPEPGVCSWVSLNAKKPAWGVFRIPALTLEFRDPSGRTLRRDVAVTGVETSVRIDLPFAPSEVRVDPDGKLLLRVTAISRR